MVFVFEGPGEGLVRDLANDPSRSAPFSIIWAPLLDGTPVLAREEFFWEAGHQQ